MVEFMRHSQGHYSRSKVKLIGQSDCVSHTLFIYIWLFWFYFRCSFVNPSICKNLLVGSSAWSFLFSTYALQLSYSDISTGASMSQQIQLLPWMLRLLPQPVGYEALGGIRGYDTQEEQNATEIPTTSWMGGGGRYRNVSNPLHPHVVLLYLGK